MQSYRLPNELLNMKLDDELFMMLVQGNGMDHAGILNNDYIIFRKTATPSNGSIVVVDVKGELICRRYFKERNYIRLRRENGNNEEIRVRKYEVKGEMVSLIRNVQL